jgi:hypothetical protein
MVTALILPINPISLSNKNIYKQTMILFFYFILGSGSLSGTILELVYSYLKASIGLKLAPRLAG